MRRILVLGGTGFIGASIVRELRQRPALDVAACGSRDFDLRDADQTLTQLGPLVEESIVIYAAGIPRMSADDLQTMFTNVTMVQNVVDALSGRCPRGIVLLSSAEVYGTPMQLPVTESTPLRPDTLYGVGKVAVELLLARWCRGSGVPLAILRLPGVYGPPDGGRSVIGMMLRAAHSGQPFTLAGGGRDERDYVFVDDVASAVSMLAEGGFQSSTINVATGRSLTIREIFACVTRLCGPCPTVETPGSANPRHLRFDVTLRECVLPDLSLRTVEDGLWKTINWEGGE